MRNLRNILKHTEGPYDVVAMLSGGKDSVLMIHDLLKTHPTLRVFCITYNDGFLGEQAERNVEKVCRHFGLDNLTLRCDFSQPLNTWLASDLPQQVDVYTFLEVFQNLFWGKVQEIALALGDLPVITGNLGYFSSEELLPEQYRRSLEFIAEIGVEIEPVEAVFISYWAEETYPEDKSILDRIGWESGSGLNTEQPALKRLRERLNTKFPKRTLDDEIEEKWEYLTTPRFRS